MDAERVAEFVPRCRRVFHLLLSFESEEESVTRD